ncbi:MAG: insulinase family protein [Muribaculaceae bacterium]|nr:insulinase family protein [Muribaculaceae bacterium]
MMTQEARNVTREVKREIQAYELSNGLRIVHVNRPSAVSWCGLAVGAGSRDEAQGQYGLAHFVEHTIFKGTTHRRSWHILNRMERVGGELNAYTTKEETMLYTIFPSQHLERAVELIADLVQNSIFPIDELTREQDVVLEEAASYRDTPAEAVYDDFEDLVLAGSQLGHNVLGVENDLRGLTQNHCMDYLHHLYTPKNMVLFYVGDTSPKRVARLAEKHLGTLHRDLQRMPRVTPPLNNPLQRVVDIGCHQAHTVVGARLPGIHDPRRYAITLLNNILGGPGMNSLLNVQLRERRGYVYTVESSVAQFSDCGLLEIYLGCDVSDVKSSLRVIDHITHDLASHHIPEHRLQSYKQQYCGQLLVAADSAEFMAFNAGKNMLYLGTPPDLNKTIDRVMAVTAEQIRAAAELITSNNCSILTYR